MNWDKYKQRIEKIKQQQPDWKEKLPDIGPLYAQIWAKIFPEDRFFLRSAVKGALNAIIWAKWFPVDKDLMIRHVKDIDSALLWVSEFPKDKERLKHLVVKDEDKYKWSLLLEGFEHD